MDLETAQTTTTAKLPILKHGIYDLWRLRIEQYFQVQDYALWDVIKNGNSFKPVAQTITNADGTSTSLILGLVTTEEKVQKKNDVKARSMLLMALPNEHLMTFNQYKDAKTLFATIQIRFGGNEATKKTQMTLLKKMYENFIWRNKPNLDTMSFDDLYNNFKIIEQEVKRTESSSSSSSSQNMASVSSPSSTNEVNIAYGVSTANTQVSPTRTQKTGRKITINRSDTAGYDKSKVECFNYHKIGHFTRECRGPRNQDSRKRNQDNSKRTVHVEETSSKAMVAIDGASFDWSYMVDNEVPTNMALMAFSDFEVNNDKTCSKTCLKSFETLKTQLDDLRIEFNKSEFNLATYKRGLSSVEEQLVFYKKNEGYSHLNLDLSYSGLEEFQQPEFEGYGPKTSKSVSEDISNEVRESPDAPLVAKLVLDEKSQSPKADYNYHQRERVVSGNNYTRVNYNYSAKKAHPSAHRNMAPRAVLMKTGLRPLNTARPVNTAHPKTTVYSARPMSRFSKSAQSTVKRPYQIRTTLTNKNFSQKVNTAKGKFYTARPKAVNTARPNSAVVNAVRANQGHPQKEDQGYVDSGCSRHMTGNMSYLSDFKEFDGGYVTFGGGAKGGKITGKGTLKIDVRTASTPIDTEKPLLKNSDSDDVDVHLYSDYARASLDRKSIIGGCQFLGCRLISWQCKKQTVVATSSIKAKYMAVASCCGQVLWIQNQMLDYGISKAVWLDLVISIVEFVRGKLRMI
ncbi:ribonuclease H-like domain-containing protein [Tanacetum coccineum]